MGAGFRSLPPVLQGHLEGHDAVEPQVLRQVYDTHPDEAEDAIDFIPWNHW